MARRALFVDTNADAEQFLFDTLRGMDAKKRAELNVRHNDNCLFLMRDHVSKARYGWPSEWLNIEWARIQHGEDIALSLANALAGKAPAPIASRTWSIGDRDMMPEAPAMRCITDALDHLDVAWFVGGSMAACCWGHGRPARDVDIIAPGLLPEHGKYLQQELGSQFFEASTTLNDACVWNFVHRQSALKIDVFAPALGGYEREAMQRRLPFELFGAGTEFWVEGVEDVVLSRLRWVKSSGRRERAWNDAVGVLKASVFDGFKTLHWWAPRFGVAELLEDAIEAAGLKDVRDALDESLDGED